MAACRVNIFLFIFVSTFGWSQADNQSLNYRLNVTRFDFFSGVEYSRSYKALQPYVAFEIGINRTIFQRRFFPKMIIGLTYDLIKNEKILLGPTIHTAYSLLKVNRNSGHFHHWNELMMGIRFETGNKWKYIFIAEYGFVGESYFDQNSQEKELIGTHGYLISMGFGYAW